MPGQFNPTRDDAHRNPDTNGSSQPNNNSNKTPPPPKPKKAPVVATHTTRLNAKEIGLNIGWGIALFLATTLNTAVRLVRAPFAFGISLAAMPLAFVWGVLHVVVFQHIPLVRHFSSAVLQLLTNRILGWNDHNISPIGLENTKQVRLNSIFAGLTNWEGWKAVLKKHAIEGLLTALTVGLVLTGGVLATMFVPAAASSIATWTVGFPLLSSFFAAVPAVAGLGFGAASLSSAAGLGVAFGIVGGAALGAASLYEFGLNNNNSIALVAAYENPSAIQSTSLELRTKTVFGQMLGRLYNDLASLFNPYFRGEDTVVPAPADLDKQYLDESGNVHLRGYGKQIAVHSNPFAISKTTAGTAVMTAVMDGGALDADLGLPAAGSTKPKYKI